MGILAFLLLGLIAGAIAKLILPGKQSGGWLITLVLGVLGAVLGGFFELSSWLLAIGGALIVLVIYGALTGRKRA